MKNKISFYPAVIALNAVMALYIANSTEVLFEDVWRSLAIVSVGAILLQALLSIWIEDRQKTGLLTAMVVFLFFSYGHIDMLMRYYFLKVDLRLILMFVFGLVISAWFFWVLKRMKDTKLLISFLFLLH
ncbi:MAG: hypothetical protein MUO76_20485 [Anaerolineaceae bacterium]|nr:hypothetical protein [Anaerolineaceae bacterium]